MLRRFRWQRPVAKPDFVDADFDALVRLAEAVLMPVVENRIRDEVAHVMFQLVVRPYAEEIPGSNRDFESGARQQHAREGRDRKLKSHVVQPIVVRFTQRRREGEGGRRGAGEEGKIAARIAAGDHRLQ